MLSNHKIQAALEEMKSISRIEMALYNESGKLLAETFDQQENLETVVAGFEAYMVGKLAVCQIRHLAEAYQEQFDRNSFMQNILLGNMLVVDMYNKARKFHIEQAERVVFVIEIEGKKDTYAMELVKGMFGASARDFITEVDEQSILIARRMKKRKS